MNIKSQKISFVLPCLNEEEGVKIVIPEIIKVANKYNIDNYEIIIADNDSTDKSVETANRLASEFNIANRLKTITEKRKGYGSAYMAGLNNANGEIFILADCDGSYDFNNINNFLQKIDEGYELVTGNRFSGKMEKAAMPFSNRYIGNPILSGLVRFLFNIKTKDIHSGMRCMTKDTFKKLDLKTTGMEFASEMIVNAGKKKIRYTEIDMNYRVRHGDSKLKKIRDGFRHLKFIFSQFI